MEKRPQVREGLGFVKKILTGESSLAVLSRGASAVLALLSTIVLARALGAEGYGSFAFGIAAMGIVVVFGLLGLDQLTAKELSILYHDRKWGAFRAFVKWSGLRLLSASAVAAVLGGILIVAFPAGGDFSRVGLIMMVGVPLLAYLRLIRGRFQAVDRTGAGIFLELPLPNIGLVLLGLLIMAIPSIRTAQVAAVGYVAILLICVILGHAVFSKKVGLSKTSPENFPNAQTAKYPFWNIAILSIVATFHMHGFILLVSYFFDAASTGLYAVANRSALMITLFLGPIQMAAAPKIARAWKEGDRSQIKSLSRSAARVGFILSLPILVLFLVFPSWYLSFFGNEYRDAVPLLRILAIGQLIFVVLGPAQMVLTMGGQATNAAIDLAVSFFVGAIVGVLLIPHYGVIGATIGASVGLILKALSTTLRVWRLQGVFTSAFGCR